MQLEQVVYFNAYMNNIHITESGMLRTIDKINATKTSRPDKISSRALKEVKEQISQSLLILLT